MPGQVRVDIDHLGESTLVRGNDMDLDSHPNAQRHGGRHPCSVKVDDDGLAFTHQRWVKTLGFDPNLQLNPCTSSGSASAVLGGHLPYLPLRRSKNEISKTTRPRRPGVAACRGARTLSAGSIKGPRQL